MLWFGVRRVVGDSMIPNLSENTLILVRKTKNYRVGDVVGFVHQDKTLIKRVFEIKDAKYYLLGDNQKNSLDSRSLGWISSDRIKFKLIFKF